jgi:hypothetical protein
MKQEQFLEVIERDPRLRMVNRTRDAGSSERADLRALGFGDPTS